MSGQIAGTNTLYCDLKCPQCGTVVRSGVGFKVGCVNGASYHLGGRLNWNGTNCRPAERPDGGHIKTIGYFNCDNLRCDTWRDCFPDVQEVLLTIKGDVLEEVCVITHKPAEQSFDIIEPTEV